MNGDYKNWVPKGMLYAFFAGSVCCLALCAAAALHTSAHPRPFLMVSALLSGLAALGLFLLFLRFLQMHHAFDYQKQNSVSSRVIAGVARYVALPEGGKGLDVGCGSGALTVRCALDHPGASMVGLDRWGREYATYSKRLCEQNARSDGASNATFTQGNALHLPFPDESFDAVVSNYVYHNIAGADKQACLLETLRVLKKGGSFALHDLMSPARYGDMDAFVRQLKQEGYQKVELIDTADGRFITRSEAGRLMLSGSRLLTGVK